MVVIVALTLYVSVIEAYSRPFWHDEMYTALIGELPDYRVVWTALMEAVDANPPPYYYATRFARTLVSDDHIANRLPSILGFLLVILGVYAALADRVDRISALAAATLPLTLPAASFAYEARPYGLMLACVCCAILAWQRTGHGHQWEWALAGSLAAAVSLHYYAVLVWPAFVAAECVRSYLHRTLRPRVWAALVVGALPLLVFRGHLAVLQEYYGHNPWSTPTLGQIVGGPNLLFTVRHAGFLFAVAVAAGLAYRVVKSRWIPQPLARLSAGTDATKRPWTIEEDILVLGLLAIPAVGVAIAAIFDGDMADRYMLPAVVGGAIGVGLLLAGATAPLRWFVLLALLGIYASQIRPLIPDLLQGRLADRRAARARSLESLIRPQMSPGAPIVVSDVLKYLPLTRYLSPDLQPDLYALVDPVSAVQYAGTDSVDRNLQVLRRYVQLGVVDYPAFVSAHRTFLLVSTGGTFDWWPARLLQDGHQLTLLAAENEVRIYRVTLASR